MQPQRVIDLSGGQTSAGVAGAITSSGILGSAESVHENEDYDALGGVFVEQCRKFRLHACGFESATCVEDGVVAGCVGDGFGQEMVAFGQRVVLLAGAASSRLVGGRVPRELDERCVDLCEEEHVCGHDRPC